MPDVTYSLHIEGEAAEKRVLRRLQRIEVEEHADMADMLRLAFAASVREDESGWSLVDDDLFQPFAHLRLGLQVGAGVPSLLLNAHVIDLDVELSNEPGRSTLEVVAMDHTVLMNREEKIKHWKKMRHSEIAREIFDQYELASRVGETVAQTEPGEQELEAPIIQRGTDAQLLKRLAERNGYLFYVETNTETENEEGYFHPLEREQTALDAEAQPPLRVSMGPATNVASFDVRYEMTKPFEAVGAGMKAGSKEKQEGRAETPADTSLGRTSTLEQDRGKKFVRARLGQRDGEVQAYRQVAAKRSSYAIRATGQLRIVDYEHVLRAKRPVQVEGAGDTFSVRYYVEQVQHTITEEQYTQDFTLRSNAQGAQRT